MELHNIFEKKCCHIGIPAKTKDQALERLADLAMKSPRAQPLPSGLILKKLKEREEQGSTGFGDELAIPHARIPGLKDFIFYIVVEKKGVEFNALDKKKVKIFFVILSPEESVSDHLQILATISRAISGKNTLKEFLSVTSIDALEESFLRNLKADNNKKTKQEKMKLMVIILFLDEFLYHILEFFIQEGIEGATIFDSSGMGKYISSIPLFATFIGFMNEKKNLSQTIMVLIPEEKEKSLIKGLEEITGTLDNKAGAMIMTLDVSTWKGSMKMM